MSESDNVLDQSDVTPEGVRAWAQYAEVDTQEARDSAAVHRTTVAVHGVVVKVSSDVMRRPDVSPQEYGTEVHTVFARTVRATMTGANAGVPVIELHALRGPRLR